MLKKQYLGDVVHQVGVGVAPGEEVLVVNEVVDHPVPDVLHDAHIVLPAGLAQVHVELAPVDHLVLVLLGDAGVAGQNHPDVAVEPHQLPGQGVHHVSQTAGLDEGMALRADKGHAAAGRWAMGLSWGASSTTGQLPPPPGQFLPLPEQWLPERGQAGGAGASVWAGTSTGASAGAGSAALGRPSFWRGPSSLGAGCFSSAAGATVSAFGAAFFLAGAFFWRVRAFQRRPGPPLPQIPALGRQPFF